MRPGIFEGSLVALYGIDRLRFIKPVRIGGTIKVRMTVIEKIDKGGVEKPREAMILRAPETEALYEGSAQKGFGVPSLDGSPMPLGSTATGEPIEIPRSLWGRWKSLDATGLKTLWFKKQNNPKQININDNQ